MNRLTFAALAVLLTCPAVSLFAQNNDDMKAMMAYSTPGDIHKMMARSAGSWTGVVTMWMQPGAPPVSSTAESTSEMILGGRCLQSKNTGSFMGQPFEGLSIMGYDNAKKVFVSSWIDNMGTGMMYMTGTWDPQTKSINFTGTEVDPMAGKDVSIREVWQMVDDNNQVMDMYSVTDGKEFKAMEIKFTRK
jgi:hypothetical protein